MKYFSSDFSHGRDRFQFRKIQNMTEENGRSSLFLLISKWFSAIRAIWTPENLPVCDVCVPNKGVYHSVNFSGPSKTQEAVIIRLRHTAIN